MENSVVLVSSGQPSANPRLVKEAVALCEMGYDVTVIYCLLSPWADEFDELLFQKYPSINWVPCGTHMKKQPVSFFYIRLRFKLYQYLYRLFGNYRDFALKSMVFYSSELKKLALKQKAAIYIGHNLGSLPAVIAASLKYHALAFFDFEDFHRGEDVENSIHWKKVSETEEKFIPSLTGATASSPLIAEAYQKLFPKLEITCVNNCFSLAYSLKEVKQLPLIPLKLFWFSQAIGKKRGLETVVKAIGITGSNNIVLSLLGTCNGELKNYFLAIAKEAGLQPHQLIFLEPVAEEEIVRTASLHHIGLACEELHIPNRDVCLTNKIFMYLLAGNACLFSNTKAQALFLKQYPGIGYVYEQNNTNQVAELLNYYLQNSEVLLAHRSRSLHYALNDVNWDQEKTKLKTVYKLQESWN